ncbi:MAG: DUF2065 domain-containing protein [Alphaproteobacteria bacterium]|nr:DUF2065 domain-containing protein [Alphaproteobacteria bacterium]
MELTTFFLTALALAFVIEGLAYAVFPDLVRKMMAIAITMPVSRLRTIGLGIAFLGCITLWFMKKLGGL